MFKTKKTLLLAIILLAFFLRFFKLGEVPYGFYQDESAIGYNAYSISQTGRDEYGQKFPLYFKSFGDYKLPVYIYLTTLAVKIFGLNEFAVRFPSALFSFLTVIAFYFFIREVTKNYSLALVATLLLAINPWHLHYGRATFEVSICLFLFVVGPLLLHQALFNKKKGLFLVGSLCFVLNIYTYNLTRLLSPFFFGLVVFIYRKELKNIKRSELIVTVVTSIVVLLPFIFTLFQSQGLTSAKGTLIWSSAVVQAQLLEFRSYFINLPSLFTKLFFNQLSLTKWQYFNNISSYFSAPFFFISGSPHGNHGIGNVGQFYLFELPLMIIGAVRVVWEKRAWGRLLLLWAVLVVLVASLTREAPHATRSFFLIAPMITFSALGLFTFLTWTKKQRKIYKLILLAISGGFIIYNLVYYFSSYYVRFPVLYAKSWRSEDRTVALYIKENQDKYDKIIFDRNAGFIYTSLLFYTAYDPNIFQKTVRREVDDPEGFSEVLSFGKYEFKDINWSEKNLEQNALIITSLDSKPDRILKTFTYPTRPVVISLKQKTANYPVDEVAYAVVQTK